MPQGPPDKYKPCILNIFMMAYCTIHGGAHISTRELMRYGTVREPWPTMKDHRYEQYVATYITCTKAQARGSCIESSIQQIQRQQIKPLPRAAQNYSQRPVQPQSTCTVDLTVAAGTLHHPSGSAASCTSQPVKCTRLSILQPDVLQ